MLNKLSIRTHIDTDNVEYILHPEILNSIEEYFELDFYGKKMPAPYFINTKKRKDLRALVGKGTAEEMVLETKVWSQVKKLSLESASTMDIRNLMVDVGIGIDCSGFVYHVLNPFFKKHFGKSFMGQFRFNNNSLRQRFGRLLRPVENIGANTMTSDENCVRVEVKDVLPGYFIRGVGKQRNAYHIALVTRVLRELKDGKEITKEIEYAHSHRGYKEAHGMRRGKIIVTDPEKDFLAQDWQDHHTDGHNYLYESDLQPYPEDSGFRAMRIFT